MVAALVLLNGSIALDIRAHFGIGHDPRQVLTLTGVLELPLLPHVAVSWPVLLLTAFEAEAVSTLTIHNMLIIIVGYPLGCVVAFLAVGTPLYVLVIICERLTIPPEIPIEYHPIIVVVL